MAIDCDFSALLSNLKVIFGTTGGYAALTERYFEHFFEINDDVSKVKACSSDWAACGSAAGEIVKTMVEWTL
jgi:hypothetical protein